MNIELERYHGLGNDYLVFDPTKNDLQLTRENIKLICDRHFGIGADGILVGPVFGSRKISARFFNPDGSEAKNNGNGAGIFAKYLRDADYIQKSCIHFYICENEVKARYLNEEGNKMQISMGKLSFFSDQIPVSGPVREIIREEMVFHNKPYLTTCVSVGNPHCVILMEEISPEIICSIAPFAENAACFPNRINMEIIKVLDDTNIQAEVYERGAGYTLASGSGACAAAGAAYRLGLTKEKLWVHMPGGTMEVEIGKDDEVLMTGEVCHIGRMTLSDHFSEKLVQLSEGSEIFY